MEWVSITAKTVEAARDEALDRLGVAADEAEFEIVEEPRPGLFGRVRGQARVRARIRPTPVRPKQERRRKGREKSKPVAPAAGAEAAATDEPVEATGANGADEAPETPSTTATRSSSRGRRDRTTKQTKQTEEQSMNDEQDRPESTATPEEVGEAAVAFMSGLTDAFGFDRDQHAVGRRSGAVGGRVR